MRKVGGLDVSIGKIIKKSRWNWWFMCEEGFFYYKKNRSQFKDAKEFGIRNWNYIKSKKMFCSVNASAI